MPNSNYSRSPRLEHHQTNLTLVMEMVSGCRQAALTGAATHGYGNAIASLPGGHLRGRRRSQLRQAGKAVTRGLPSEITKRVETIENPRSISTWSGLARTIWWSSCDRSRTRPQRRSVEHFGRTASSIYLVLVARDQPDSIRDGPCTSPSDSLNAWRNATRRGPRSTNWPQNSRSTEELSPNGLSTKESSCAASTGSLGSLSKRRSVCIAAAGHAGGSVTISDSTSEPFGTLSGKPGWSSGHGTGGPIPIHEAPWQTSHHSIRQPTPGLTVWPGLGLDDCTAGRHPSGCHSSGTR